MSPRARVTEMSSIPGMHWLPASAPAYSPSSTSSFASRFKEEQVVRMWKERSEQASWIDAGLRGPRGAQEVLNGLTPSITELVLSHNTLGDEGVRVLCEGLLEKRKQGYPGILELNLTSNGITDQGLFHIVKYLLLGSRPPKSLPTRLARLFLSNNSILLSPDSPLPSLLAAALSHPESQLEFLSLISNEGIHLQFLKSCTPTTLRTLQIDTCALGDYRPLADFIKQKEGGGRLEHLRANGNYFGTKGVRRLARLVAEGENTSLTKFELSANSCANSRVQSDSEDTAAQSRRDSDTSEDDDEGRLELDDGVDAASVFMIPGLTKALGRNAVLKEMTHRSCLSLIPFARVLMLAQPPLEETEAQLMDIIATSSRSDSLTMSTEDLQSPSGRLSSAQSGFPWLRLPSEIRNTILRHLGLLIEGAQVVGMAAIIQTRLPPKYRSDSILTPTQFVKLLDFAADRRTLSWGLDKLHTVRAAGCERWEAYYDHH